MPLYDNENKVRGSSKRINYCTNDYTIDNGRNQAYDMVHNLEGIECNNVVIRPQQWPAEVLKMDKRASYLIGRLNALFAHFFR